MKNKGQVTIFIIIAVIIVALVSLFFIFKGKIIGPTIPSDIASIHNTLVTCLEEDMETGVYLLESQGGYIYLPDFEASSNYMPFSSQLNFMGNSIPYWYYVSGNNIQKEQVPSKSEMESSLEEFVESKISKCIFDSYYTSGYRIDIGKPKAKVTINDKRVDLDLDLDFDITKGGETASIKTHEVSINSKLGSLYNSALKVYEEEQKTLFLENYSVDVLRMYAPVDGVELTCSPKVWEANSIFNDLQDAIEANTLALKNKGKEDDYFALNLPVAEEVHFLNSKDWAYSFEVSPSEENFLIAKPVGTQSGLGILGFCYVPYHFVYSMKYPVLVQVVSENEIFQFPLAVVILGNMPRKPLEGSAVGAEFSELCDNKNTLVSVTLYDNDLKRIDGNVSYECFGTTCLIGESEGGILYDKFPQCVNGYILVNSEGYRSEKFMHSVTTNGSSVSVFLDKVYNLGINLKLDGKAYNGEASISFVSDKISKTIVYPSEKKVELSEGDYEIQVSIYKNSSLKLGTSFMEQCIDIPRTGIGGLLGLTEKKCFNVSYPAQMISSALAGGGKQNYSLSEEELDSSNLIEISAESLSVPSSFEQLQENYILFETKSLGIIFR
jgi:hypothetical protein